jgi:hypothetical protein
MLGPFPIMATRGVAEKPSKSGSIGDVEAAAEPRSVTKRRGDAQAGRGGRGGWRKEPVGVEWIELRAVIMS